MAKVMTGPMVAEIRGKCGDVVFSRNRGGMFSRAYGVRVKPWSTNQTNIRDSLHIIGPRWNTTLTDAQRLAWNAFAQNLTKNDQLTQAAPLSGQNWWMRLNFANWWNGTGFVDDPPPTLQSLTPPLITAVTANAASHSLLITVNRIPQPNEWFPISATRPLNPGRYSFNKLFCAFAWFDAGWGNPHEVGPLYESTIAPLASAKKIALQIRTITPFTGVLAGAQLTTTIIT